MGVAVSATCDPLANASLHADAQLIPDGVLVTEPLPVTLTDNVWFCTNVAVMLCAAFIVTLQLPAPLQAPPQAEKVQPLAGVAVRLTFIPSPKSALHVDGQAMPVGPLATEPLPVTLTVRAAWPGYANTQAAPVPF